MRIPETDIEVDDFRPQDAGLYVLTHYHADHRRGLRTGDDRPMLCSTLTGRLLASLDGVLIRSIRTIDPLESLRLGVDVTVRAYDANHCPGALMLLFDVAGRRHLHTGDFRYSAEHDRHPELFSDIDTLFLDATYEAGADEWEHPSQEEAIDQVIELIERHPDHRVYLGIYTVGKNRVVRAIHERLGLKVYLSAKHHRVYTLLGMEDCVTRDRRQTRVHGHAMGYFHQWFQVRNPGYARDGIVILPTGWREGRGDGENFFYVAYSEHNSSSELRAFVAKVAPRQVVQTNEFF